MKKLLLTISIIGLSLIANAQFQGNFVQFFNNETYLNPAFAGTQISGLNFSAITRADYAGTIDGKPLAANKILLTFDKRFDDKKFGLAANLNAINFGIWKNYEMSLNYSYHLDLGKDRKLCMGLKAGGLYQDRTGEITLKEAGDNVFDDADYFKPTFTPKIGTGFAFESEKLYLGLSSPDVVSRLNITASGGYKITMGEDYYIEPNFLFRYAKTFEPKIDINTFLAKNESFWVGANYAHNNSIALMGGVYYQGRLKIGYAFDYNTNLVQGTTSHEIMLQWDLEDAL